MSTADPARLAERAQEAESRIRPFVELTPLRKSESYSSASGAEVYFKLENLQTTGSFKLRGATNRLLTLTDEQREAGCVAASSGNHGAAVACAMQRLGVRGVIFVPEQTSSAKVEKIKSYGGDVQFFGTDGLDTEQHARGWAEKNGMTYLSPYNDAQVVAGQGSCGVEIVEQLPNVDAVFVAVGGGGLIAGSAAVLKAHNPAIRIVGCQPAASAVMAHSIEAGRILDMPGEPTLSDGTAGGIEAEAITFELNQALVDEFVLVDEGQIATALRQYFHEEEQIVEGAAGVAVAGFLQVLERFQKQRVVIIICGGNIADDKFAAVLAAGDG